MAGKGKSKRPGKADMTGSMNAPSVPVRPARPEDFDAIHRLEVECMGGTALPQSQLRWLLESQGEDPAFLIRVAHLEGDPEFLTGFVCWKKRSDAVTPGYEILDLSVGTRHREDRIEHALLEDLVATAVREGMIGISVNVPRSNLAAAAFYLSYAFNVGHAVERYYADGTAMEIFVKRLK
jgi:ribosomal protein S18 acetylase RimI-like enzyme